eukprot:2345276-Pleurochrysis_carterae.AAC.1
MTLLSLPLIAHATAFAAKALQSARQHLLGRFRDALMPSASDAGVLKVLCVQRHHRPQRCAAAPSHVLLQPP